MKRFELRDGKSSKFWQVTVEGSTITTQWGRIGTGGQSKSKKLASPAAAEAAAEALIREKTAKGYEAVASSHESDRIPHLRMILERLEPADTTLCDRLGGSPNRWTDDAAWPTCGSCEKPLHFVIQLQGSNGGGRARIGDASWMQLFVCHNEGDCEFYALRSSAHHVALRHGPLVDELMQRPGGLESAVVADPLRFASSIAYEDGADLVLADDEMDEDRHDEAHERGFIDKLYGLPVAANEPDRVTCKTCSRPLSFLGQILSADDWFIYYLHACEHGHDVTFHARRA